MLRKWKKTFFFSRAISFNSWARNHLQITSTTKKKHLFFIFLVYFCVASVTGWRNRFPFSAPVYVQRWRKKNKSETIEEMYRKPSAITELGNIFFLSLFPSLPRTRLQRSFDERATIVGRNKIIARHWVALGYAISFPFPFSMRLLSRLAHN